MSRIKILSESLANQIAAGEVVERPASVVKELVENALDAGAKNIAVHIEGGGTRLIRVIDDGSGMDHDDILLCLERHATSKLINVQQLGAINTLGFRGEAIPSIASVSQLTIDSRPATAPLGYRVSVHFGSIKKVHEIGCSVGTVMEIRNLFGNVPARRKFLKSTQTEISHIDQVVRSYCLVKNRIGFSYQVNGKSIIELASSIDSAFERTLQVIGCPCEMIELQGEGGTEKEGDVRVSGYLVPPGESAARGGRLWAFVNGRAVKDRTVTHAVFEGLQGFMMKGVRPSGVIFLEVPPESVDVNVHPTKQEVRFQHSQLVHKAIVQVVRHGMVDFQGRMQKSLFTKTVVPVEENSTLPQEIDTPQQRVIPRVITEESKVESVALPFKKQTLVTPIVVSTCEESGAYVESVVQPDPEESPVEKGLLPNSHENFSIRYIGQLQGTYLFCETADGLVAIDQHAAQERLIYEELLKQYTDRRIPSQILMFPEVMDCGPEEILLLEQYDGDISRLGLEIKEFGGDSYVVYAVPATLSHLHPIDIVRGILSGFSSAIPEGRKSCRIEDVLADMACKAAIKAGHRLDPQEVDHLLEQMRSAGVFAHCPHGRPVIKRFSLHDIQKWFFRA